MGFNSKTNKPPLRKKKPHEAQAAESLVLKMKKKRKIANGACRIAV